MFPKCHTQHYIYGRLRCLKFYWRFSSYQCNMASTQNLSTENIHLIHLEGLSKAKKVRKYSKTEKVVVFLLIIRRSLKFRHVPACSPALGYRVYISPAETKNFLRIDREELEDPTIAKTLYLLLCVSIGAMNVVG